MATILIILAAIAVVWVCLLTTRYGHKQVKPKRDKRQPRFDDFLDMEAKLEEQMFNAVKKRTKEKTGNAKKTLNPANYRWGIIGMVGYFLGFLLSHFLTRTDVAGWLSRLGAYTLISPACDDIPGNIFHDEE